MFAPALLLAATLHAGLELPVSAPIRDAQPYVQRLGDVAGDDERALVVWREDTLIRGVRVDRDGNTLDAAPLLIAYAPWEYARVARGATNWLVVTSGYDRVEARLVSEDGVVGPVIPIAAMAGVPDVAFNGSEYLVVWADVNASRVVATRISAQGQRLENDILLAQPMVFHAVFAAPGGGFTVVVQQANVYALHLDARAHEVSRTALMPTFEWYDPVFGLDAEGRVLAGWHTLQDVAYVQREGGEPVALEATKVVDFTTIGGTTYAIARREENLVFATLAGSVAREIDGPIEEARAVAFGDRTLLVHSYADVFRTMLDASLETLAPQRLVYAEPELQTAPAVARAGEATLVAWVDGGSMGPVRARLNGGAAFDLGEGTDVQIATDGNDFLVTWINLLQQNFRIVAHDGTLKNGGTIAVWTVGGCVTWTGDEYVLGFAKVPLFPRGVGPTAVIQRVTRDGNVSGSLETVSGTTYVNSVSCASTDAITLFAYDDPQGNIRGTTLTRGGTLATFPIGHGVAPSVASSGNGFMAAYSIDSIVSWAAISENGVVNLERTTVGNSIRVASRPGGYLLMYGTDPLRVHPIDADGDFAGAEVAVASDALAPVFAGDTLVYMRDIDVLPQPRWRVFVRDLDLGSGRRRAARH